MLAHEALKHAVVSSKLIVESERKETAVKIENLEKRLEQYKHAYEAMVFQVKELNRQRFGSKSERFIDPAQLSLFESDGVEPESSLEEKNITVPEHQRSKKKIKKDTSHLPREIEVIAVSDEDKRCACGCEKKVIRYEAKELFDYQPAVMKILEQRREVVACPRGCEASIKTAPAPLHILPKIKATERLLAHIIVAKLHDRQPLYHLEKHHLLISRETMARWVIDVADPLQPMVNLLKDEAIAHDVAALDATTLQVLNEPDRKAQTKSLAYCMRGGPPDKRVILYGYNYETHKIYVDEWFEGFVGFVHMDADPLFERFTQDPKVIEVFCNAHARRKFDAVKQQAKKQGLAHEALRFYKQLYAVERKAKDQAMTYEQRHALRQKESKPIADNFSAWLDKEYPTVVPNSPLAKAFEYCLKRFAGLMRFLDDGRLEIDNSLTEQEIKPLVIARKNFMFCESVAGASALCLHFSLIRTALLHGLNPFEYYVALLKQIPYCKTVEDYEKLLPLNIVKSSTEKI